MTKETLRGRFEELVSGVRFGTFLSVGAVGAVFDLTVSTALVVWAGVGALTLSLAGASATVPPSVLAKLAGAEVAIVVMFFINDNVTFSDAETAAGWPRRLVRSNLVRLGGLGIQAAVVWAFSLVSLSFVAFGVDLWTLAPFPAAIAASVLFNYVAEGLFTWRIAGE